MGKSYAFLWRTKKTNFYFYILIIRNQELVSDVLYARNHCCGFAIVLSTLADAFLIHGTFK